MNAVRFSLVVGVLFFSCAALVVHGDGYMDQFNQVQSRVKAMGHGYHTQAEWNEVFSDLDRLAARAESGGDVSRIVGVQLLQALVHGDLLRDHARARSILESAKTQYGDHDSDDVRRIYARLAETYAKLGDAAAVDTLVKEFEKSPAYDPQFYATWGGAGPRDPVALQRPAAAVSDSVTVTAMQSKKIQADLRPGTFFPDFRATDRQGRPVSLAAYRGQVVLLDFWVRNWYPWERHLPHLKNTHSRYASGGFHVVGICMDRDPSGIEAYLAKHGITWPQVVGDAALPARFGIYGEATSYLIDRQGAIVGRDLSGSELVEAIKSAL